MFTNYRGFRFLASLALVAGLFSPHVVLAYGALAIDEHKGDQYGWAINYKTHDEAQKRAMSECGDGCRIVFIFNHGAAAYAADQTPGSSAYGWGRASSGAEAKAIALKEARKKGAEQPIVRAWGEESETGELQTFATKEEYALKKKLKMKQPAVAQEPPPVKEFTYIEEAESYYSSSSVLASKTTPNLTRLLKTKGERQNDLAKEKCGLHEMPDDWNPETRILSAKKTGSRWNKAKLYMWRIEAKVQCPEPNRLSK